MAHAARDISQAASPFDRDNFTAVAAQSVPAILSTRSLLPTPPNSISPSIQLQGLTARLQQLQRSQLEVVDSDLDLHEHIDNLLSGSPVDTTGAVTPGLLAQHHLPDILLNHGPLAIRHIMGYLMTSVPGFTAIPPTKARRIVVSALESHNGASPAVDVVFEKVGWGRWGARRRGQPRLADRMSPSSDGGPESSNGLAIGIPIAGGGHYRRGKNPSSADSDSIVFSHDDRDLGMMETEADRMSLDGSGSASCSEAPDDDDVMDDDDVTDDEDWAAVGAAALRAESYSTSVTTKMGFVSSPTFASSNARFPSSFGGGMARIPQTARIDYRALAVTSNPQEREAVEALLRLGSL